MQKTRKSFIGLLVIVVAIGFLSGVVGELWLNSFLMPDSYLNFKSYSDLSQKIDELVSTQNFKKSLDEKDLAASETINRIEPTVVSLYKDKKFTPLVASSLSSNDYLGQGLIITNDGWVLTNQNVLPNEKLDYSVVTSDNHVYTTEQVLADSETGAVFVKIAVNNLPVAEFNLRQNLVDGQSVFVFGEAGSAIQTNVKNLYYTNSSDLLRESEEFYKYVLLDEDLDSEFIGSPIVSLDGRISGFVLNAEGVVIPVDHLTATMKAVVQGEEWARPYLGIKYYDLAEVLNPEIERTQGALISPAAGVMVNSPAKDVLWPGDIILEIEGEELSSMRNLSDLIAQYRVDETVKFKILRGEEEMEVDVKLAENK